MRSAESCEDRGFLCQGCRGAEGAGRRWRWHGDDGVTGEAGPSFQAPPPTLGLWPRCWYPSSRLLPTIVLPPRRHHPAHFTEVATEVLRLSPTWEPEPCFGKAPTGFGQQLLRPPGCSCGGHSGAHWGSRLPPEQLNLLPLGPSVGLWPQPWSQLTQRPL